MDLRDSLKVELVGLSKFLGMGLKERKESRSAPSL